MTGQDKPTTVGQLPDPSTRPTSAAPVVLTRLVWLLCLASLGALAVRLWTGETWGVPGLVAVDGLTLVTWVGVTLISGVVHSYARRYLAGSRRIVRFFLASAAFTALAMVLVAADALALFAATWVAMGLVMADLVGNVRGWPQARAAGALARRYFLASGALVAVALATLWRATGETTVSGVAAAADGLGGAPLFLAAGALVLAAMVQSALVPFHTWLLSSMTAPTPASALMHAGFVNAGGVLLARFAPVVGVDPGVMLVLLVVGAASALLGKLLKSVQPDVKRQLGCSTVGQMGFMVAQAGLGFFGAAVTHLLLHGFYKAYLFLSAGGAVERTTPKRTGAGRDAGSGSAGPLGVAVTAASALAGGAVFVVLTGKGTALDAGLLLTLLVVLTTMHATRGVLRRTSLPARVRYGAVPLVFLPAVALYAAVYTTVTGLMTDLPVVTAPAELTVVHAAVAAAFVLAYVATETGLYRRSDRLYVALLDAARPPAGTVLTDRGEYREY
jgi:NAD(P)H-quinone oxidoreductase subunit 5